MTAHNEEFVRLFCISLAFMTTAALKSENLKNRLKELFYKKTLIVTIFYLIFQMNDSWEKLLSILPDGLCIYDIEKSSILYANTEFQRIFKLSDNDLTMYQSTMELYELQISIKEDQLIKDGENEDKSFKNLWEFFHSDLT